MRRRGAIAFAGLIALVLAGCASPKPRLETRPGPFPPITSPRPQPPPPPAERTLALSALPGWAQEDHGQALRGILETCQVAKTPDFARTCRELRAMGPLSGAQAKGLLEAHFRAEPVGDPGVLTAYFAPEFEARRRPDAEFTRAVLPPPADMAERTAPRAAIEARAPEGALAWMRPEELFFLQIQGSGVLTFEDGRRMKALYAANNGHTFTGIANPMRDRGLLARENTSGDAIRRWLAAHRGLEADGVMQLNPRYVFFRLAADDGRQPVGAAGVPLPAGRAIAVDPAYHAYGEIFWLDAEAPILTGAFPTYRRLVTALDTGGAIKGRVRADLYLGQGAQAGAEAGRVRHTLKMFRLVPRASPGS